MLLLEHILFLVFLLVCLKSVSSAISLAMHFFPYPSVKEFIDCKSYLVTICLFKRSSPALLYVAYQPHFPQLLFASIDSSFAFISYLWHWHFHLPFLLCRQSWAKEEWEEFKSDFLFYLFVWWPLSVLSLDTFYTVEHFTKH